MFFKKPNMLVLIKSAWTLVVHLVFSRPAKTCLLSSASPKHAIQCVLAGTLFQMSIRMNHATKSPTLLNYSPVGTFNSHDSVDLSRDCELTSLKNGFFTVGMVSHQWTACPIAASCFRARPLFENTTSSLSALIPTALRIHNNSGRLFEIGISLACLNPNQLV